MKKLLFIIIIGLFMSSCSTYINVGEGGRCKVPAPRKFERTKVFPTRSHPMYRMGVH
jgi:hypothetical protein